MKKYDNRNKIIDSIKENIWVLIGNEVYRDDEKIVREALKINGAFLEYASDRLRGMVDIVLAALASEISSGDIFKFAMPKLFRDRDLMDKAMKYHVSCFKYASSELKEDWSFVIQCVQNHRHVKYFIPQFFRVERKVILEIAKKDKAWALKDVKEIATQEEGPYVNAARKIIEDAEFVLECAKYDYTALACAAHELQNDREFVLKCVRQNGLVLQYYKGLFKSDVQIAIQAIAQNPQAAKFISLDLRKNFEFIKECKGIVQALQILVWGGQSVASEGQGFVWDEIKALSKFEASMKSLGKTTKPNDDE